LRTIENAEALPEADRADGCPHPREVYSLLGHETAETRFLKAMRSGRMHHAWLLTGPKGIGKATLSYRMARKLLGGEALLSGSLDIPAENAILKLLEEPPTKTLFILISSAPGRLLPTIRSRCMSLELRAVPDAQITDWLSEHGRGSPDLIDAAVRLSRGAPGKALALVQNADVVLRSISDYLQSLGRDTPNVDMTIAKRLAEKRNVISRGLFWDSLDDTIHAHALFAATGNYQGPFSPAKIDRSAKIWQLNHARLRDVRRAEGAINLDKTAAMFELLSDIRAAS